MKDLRPGNPLLVFQKKSNETNCCSLTSISVDEAADFIVYHWVAVTSTFPPDYIDSSIPFPGFYWRHSRKAVVFLHLPWSRNIEPMLYLSFIHSRT